MWSAEERAAALDALRALGSEWRAVFVGEEIETVSIGNAKPYLNASALFMQLLPEVERYSREQRMASADVTPEEIRRASDMDLATRLRMKRQGKAS